MYLNTEWNIWMSAKQRGITLKKERVKREEWLIWEILMAGALSEYGVWAFWGINTSRGKEGFKVWITVERQLVHQQDSRGSAKAMSLGALTLLYRQCGSIQYLGRHCEVTVAAVNFFLLIMLFYRAKRTDSNGYLLYVLWAFCLHHFIRSSPCKVKRRHIRIIPTFQMGK